MMPLKPAVKGANVLYYPDATTSYSARITGVHPDGSVSLVVFSDDPSISVIQQRPMVPYAPGVAGGWGWNDEYNSSIIDSCFYKQETPASVWSVPHGLRKLYPSVRVYNQQGQRVYGGEQPIDEYQMSLFFQPPLAGFAILE